MGLTVAAYNACPVNSEDHMLILQADIMQHLVISPLQKRRIDRKYRYESFHGQSCRKCNRMLLRNPYIKKSIRKLIVKTL